VKDGRVMTSTGDYCFNGVTRGNVIDLCRRHEIPITLGDFELADVHAADEAFVTGTFGGLTPVRSIDGHAMKTPLPGPVTTRLRAAYEALKDEDAARSRVPA
jgi:branched-chain amino acid aminotransferase